MKLSHRADLMPASPIRKLVPFADEAKSKGYHVYHLNIGQPDIDTPEVFLESIKKRYPQVISYAHSQGIKECIQAFRSYYESVHIPLQPNEIQITTGGSEALLFAMAAVCDVGDEIIVFEPFYTNYNGFAVLLNINLVPITTYAENGYHLPDKKTIQSCITPKTRAIIFCNPNNPTGTVFNHDEIQMLGDLAKENDIFLIADEVYREFIYDGLNHSSVMNVKGIEDRVILTDSLSKRFSLCGGRIGCLVSKNKQVMDAVLRMGQARLSSPTLEQLGSIDTLALSTEYYQGIIDEYQKRRDIVYSALQKMDGVVCKEPKGAFYVFVKLPIHDTDHFAKWMLTDFQADHKTVMIAPGEGFYASKGKGTDEIRIAYVLQENDLKDAMEILRQALDTYRSIQ